MLEEHLGSLVNQLIEDDQYFLVDIKISNPASGRNKILVLIDGDEGIDIDFCAYVSRKLGAAIEENEWVDHAYTLEVSSPGLEHPIKLKRQYVKNIGRNVKVVDKENVEWRGELLEVNDDHIKIQAEIKEKGKKKVVLEEKAIPFSNIEKTQVLVSFK